MHSILVFTIGLIALMGPAVAATLKPRTLAAWQSYVQQREAQIDKNRVNGRHFLWLDEDSSRRGKVRAGEVVVDDWVDGPSREIPEGMIQDWVGAVFVPGAIMSDALGLVQDYDNHKRFYGPEVVDSRLRDREGDRFRVFLRLLKRKVITVVLNTDHDVRYFPVSASRVHSRSVATRIVEVDNPGEPGEREMPPGNDNGFMWRWNSYWRFEERDGGVYVECESISLSRSVPFGLNLMLEPILRSLPRESLEHTLVNTRKAIQQSHGTGNPR